MTTIAYKDGIVAYDTRVCSGDFIMEDNYEKRIVVENVSFFIAGAISDNDNFIACYFDGEEPSQDNDNAALVVTKEGELWVAAINQEYGFWKRKLNLNNPYTMGSGGQYAISAMDLGLSAAEAVKFAFTRDCKSGGRVKTYRIPGYGKR
jgi:ATP-dependent protease HslVU (ClpYQ) peptidase subunit